MAIPFGLGFRPRSRRRLGGTRAPRPHQSHESAASAADCRPGRRDRFGCRRRDCFGSLLPAAGRRCEIVSNDGCDVVSAAGRPGETVSDAGGEIVMVAGCRPARPGRFRCLLLDCFGCRLPAAGRRGEIFSAVGAASHCSCRPAQRRCSCRPAQRARCSCRTAGRDRFGSVMIWLSRQHGSELTDTATIPNLNKRSRFSAESYFIVGR